MSISRRAKLLTFCVSLFFVFLGNLWATNLVERFRTEMEKSLSDDFGMKISIDSVRGGILRNIVLNGVQFGDSGVQARRVILGLRAWDIAFRGSDSLRKVRIVDPTLHLSARAYSLFTSLPVRQAGMASKKEALPEGLTVLIDGGTVSLEPKGLAVSNLSGEVRLNGNTTYFKGIKGELFGMLVSLDGSIENGTAAPRLNFDFAINGPRIGYSGRAYGELANPTIDGNLTLMGKFSAPLRGDVSVKDGALFIDNFSFGNTVSSGASIMISMKNEGDSTRVATKLSDVKVVGAELSTYAEASIKPLAESSGILSGELSTYGTLWNRKPFYETELSYKLSRNFLEVVSLNLGDNLRCSGKISTARPYFANLVIKLEGAPFDELLSVLSRNGFQSLATGAVDGEIKIQGPIAEPLVKANLLAKDGNVGDLYFDTLNLKMQGRGALLHLFDSRASREDTVLLLEGDVDLSKPGGSDIFRNLTIKTQQGEVVWEGWQKAGSGGNLSLGSLPKDFQIGLQKYVNEPGYSAGSQDGALELKYNLPGRDSLLMRYRQDEQVIGIEHKRRF